MKTRDLTDPDKLRGGFYTPDTLVELCLDRVAGLTRGRTDLALLEPSAGDGAFIRGLARSPMRHAVASVLAIEVAEAEAAKGAAVLRELPLAGSVECRSAVEWAATTDGEFDVAVGNPPFVRFQFVSETDRASSIELAQRLGISFTGVSNLWLPVLVGALSRLRTDGAFAFVIPAECFTGISAGVLREWLVRRTTRLQFDLFPPDSFPCVLQEVVVVSGICTPDSGGPAKCRIVEHLSSAAPRAAEHSIPSGKGPWTKYLLTPRQLSAYDAARDLSVVSRLGFHARFEVAAVTGANSFFSVDESTLQTHGLGPWALPLLPRIRHAPGLAYTADDHEVARQAGARVHLLDFSADRDDPGRHPGPADYLETGVDDELHLRYKCRIREPWYRVPFIRPGALMLSKRSHEYPRVVVNELDAVTTDTIYRGTLTDACPGSAADLAAGFHNSLTLLSAELEGRSFGGGVLELVPSEVARLEIPMLPGFEVELRRLDSVARAAVDGQSLIDETDRLLMKADVGFDQDLIDLLASGRQDLMARRLDRNASS